AINNSATGKNSRRIQSLARLVDSWRHSSGHWSAVYHRQPRFGYDMKRGVNGIWYATGLFGNYQ
ncbi:MAG TPA: hypothetical protein VJ783_28310, partial [Pirellulales bacterium]|nr:hypothetical protein [Pirellulales bacterium]